MCGLCADFCEIRKGTVNVEQLNRVCSGGGGERCLCVIDENWREVVRPREGKMGTRHERELELVCE